MYLTVPQLAKRLRVRRSKIIDWITSGKLPALNVGTKRPSYRVAEADLQYLRVAEPKRKSSAAAVPVKSYF